MVFVRFDVLTKGLDMNLTKLLAGLLGVAAGSSAIASPPAANGVMEFPNVSVVAQAPRETARTVPEPARAAPQADGMMAYKDPVTGKLTAPTPQQATALTGPPRGAMPAPSITLPPHGGIAITLDERHERYARARKDADGKLSETCEPESTVGEHHEK